jgi:hypothetical protein
MYYNVYIYIYTYRVYKFKNKTSNILKIDSTYSYLINYSYILLNQLCMLDRINAVPKLLKKVYSSNYI